MCCLYVQACLDLEPFIAGSQYVSGSMFNLTSAPVLFHLEHDPSLFAEIDKGIESVQNVDYAKVCSWDLFVVSAAMYVA